MTIWVYKKIWERYGLAIFFWGTA